MANTGSTNPDRQSGRIDIGGRRLAFVCAGDGPPTVILETGLGAESAEWAAVQGDVSKVARVLRYDRAGRGASDTAPSPRPALDMVGDLRELLRRTAIGGPYVLVGHSFGGLLARLFAHHHARDVAGVVLVDSMHEDQFEIFGRMFPPPFPGEPEELTRTRTFWQGGWRDPSSTAEGIDFVRSFEQAKEIGSLGTIPVEVITAGALLNPAVGPREDAADASGTLGRASDAVSEPVLERQAKLRAEQRTLRAARRSRCSLRGRQGDDRSLDEAVNHRTSPDAG